MRGKVAKKLRKQVRLFFVNKDEIELAYKTWDKRQPKDGATDWNKRFGANQCEHQKIGVHYPATMVTVGVDEDGEDVLKSVSIWRGNPFRGATARVKKPMPYQYTTGTRVLDDCMRKYYQAAKAAYKAV